MAVRTHSSSNHGRQNSKRVRTLKTSSNHVAAVSVKGRCNSYTGAQWALVMMLPKASLGRDRNKVKFSKWGFYLKFDGPKSHNSVQKLMDVCRTHKARVPGGKNQPLVLTKVSKTKVEIAWPLAVAADTCTRLLKLALGENWRSFVTDPARVQGAHQKAATAGDGAVTAEAAGEGTLSAETPASRGAYSSAAGPRSPRTPLSGATVASSAAAAEARSGVICSH